MESMIPEIVVLRPVVVNKNVGNRDGCLCSCNLYVACGRYNTRFCRERCEYGCGGVLWYDSEQGVILGML